MSRRWTCPAEERLIRNRLEGMADVEELRFNLMQRELTVSHRLEDDAPVFAALQELKMDLRRQSESGAPAGHTTAVSTRTKLFVGFSGCAAITAEIIGWTTGNEQSPLVIGLCVLAIALGGGDTIKKGFVALKTFTLNINFLMMIAIAGAMLIGEWPETAVHCPEPQDQPRFEAEHHPVHWHQSRIPGAQFRQSGHTVDGRVR